MNTITSEQVATSSAATPDADAMKSWPLAEVWAEWRRLDMLAKQMHDQVSKAENLYDALFAHQVPSSVRLDASMREVRQLAGAELRGTNKAHWITSEGWRTLASVAKARGLQIDEKMVERYAAATAAFQAEPSNLLAAADNLAKAEAAWEAACDRRDHVADILHDATPETLDDLTAQISYLAHLASSGFLIDAERACDVFIQAARVLGEPAKPEGSA